MYNITKQQLDDLAVYMDDDTREQVHAEKAPCSPAEFLAAYLEAAPEFAAVVEEIL